MLCADWRQLAQAGERNSLGQPVGRRLEAWSGARHPPRLPLLGCYGRLELLRPQVHGLELFEALHRDADGSDWSYLNQGPFSSLSEWQAWAEWQAARDDALSYAIVDAGSSRAVGLACYLNISPPDGCIEVGGLSYSPQLRRSRLATEAMYLMMRQAFALGYRRCEWKCDAHNQASIRAARRLGFVFECLWRQRRVSKGRNRDAACFSMLDHEWPARRDALQAWLAEDNFDASGAQRRALAQFVALQERNCAAGFMLEVGGVTMDACNR